MDVIKKRNAFGISELLVTITIIGVISAALFIGYSHFMDKGKSTADLANIKTLNSATLIYAMMYPERRMGGDIFGGIETDDGRIDALAATACIASKAAPQQKNVRFTWVITDQVWIIDDAGGGHIPTPIEVFEKTSGTLIDLIIEYYTAKGSYPRNWGDYRYTDLGLDPEEWKKPIGHIIYTPSGDLVRMRPESGYSLFFELVSGTYVELKSSHNWDLIYDLKTQKWYWHEVTPAKEVRIETLVVPQ